MNTTPLRDLVAQSIEGRWTEWARSHPNLAEVIDRTRLIDMTVERLRDDPQFTAAMQQAQVDERTLLQAMALVQQVERWVVRLLPL